MGFLCKTFGHKWERLLNECSRRCRVELETSSINGKIEGQVETKSAVKAQY